MSLQAAMDFLQALARFDVTPAVITDHEDLEQAAIAAGFSCTAAEIDQAFRYACALRAVSSSDP